MPQMDEKLKSILQKMIEEGQTDEMIRAVIKHHQSLQTPSTPTPSMDVQTPIKPATPIANNEPDTWWGGFMNSMRPGGESDQASLAGLGGFAKGAILDLPSSIIGGIKSIGNAIMDPTAIPGNIVQGVKDFGQHASDTFSKAGSDSEGFGRLMGQLTGQPLTMELGIPSAMAATRMAGKPVAGMGRLLKDKQPITGMIPFDGIGMRTPRMIEGGVGSGIERVGEAMKGIGQPKPPFNMPSTPGMNEIGNPNVMPSSAREIIQTGPSRPINISPSNPSSYTPSSSPYEFGDYTRLTQAENLSNTPIAMTGTSMDMGQIPTSPTPYIDTVNIRPSAPSPTGTGMSSPGMIDTAPTNFPAMVPDNPSSPMGISSGTGGNFGQIPTQPTPYSMSVPSRPNPQLGNIANAVANNQPSSPNPGMTQPDLFSQPIVPNAPQTSQPILSGKSIIDPSTGEVLMENVNIPRTPQDPFHEIPIGGKISLPSEIVTPARIKSLEQQGFKVVETTAKGDVRFQKIKSFLKDTEGSFNLDALKKFFGESESSGSQLPSRMVPDSGGQLSVGEGMPPLDIQGAASPTRGPNKSIFQMTPDEVAELLSGVFDENGRLIAPSQSKIQPRPPGPWDKNY